MNRLSNMTREQLERFIFEGQNSDQDVIDLYLDLKQRETEIDELENKLNTLRSNYDPNYWEEQDKEWNEDFPDED